MSYFNFKATGAALAIVLGLCACKPEPETPPTPSTRNDMAAAQANLNLALDYLQAQDTENAKDKIMLAMREEPNYAPTWYTKGYFDEVTKHLPEAEADYKRAVTLDKNSGMANNNYGTFLCRNGRYKEAIAQFITAANQSEYLHAGGAYENAGICALEIPDEEAAKGFFLQALNNEPDRKSSTFELAKIYYHEDNTAMAKQYFDRYAKLANIPEAQYASLMNQHVALRR